MSRIAFSLGLILASFAFAQDAPNVPPAEPAGKAPAPATVEQQESPLPFSIDGAVDIPTAYVFRGYRIHDSGVQVQPSLNISKEIDAGDFSISPHVGGWANLTSDEFGSQGWRHADEADVTGGVAFGYKNMTLDVVYNYYAYPSHSSGDASEVGATLSYDDSDNHLLHLPFALNPHVGFFQELSDLGDRSRDTYFEVGIEPSHDFNVKGLNPLTLSLPVTFGGSFDTYYVNADGSNTAAGFTMVGLHAKYPFSKHFDVHGGVDYYYLLADSTTEANGGNNNLVVGSIGLGFSF